jgi:N,N'-diacetyllegionaminate synthase
MKDRVIIIAEAGVNHNGDISNAKKLIEAAAIAKADYVKFQSFKAKDLVSPDAKKAEYQMANTNDEGGNQFEMLQSLELSHQDHLALIEHCNKCDIKFMSTAFDVEGLKYLQQFNLDFIKCPSGEITNYPYLKEAAKQGRNVILSTGMSTLEDIGNALKVFLDNGLSADKITVLHCNTEYPTPYSDVNLKAMNQIGEMFNVNVGYSDHTLGIEVPIAAVALGANVIEKHFTLNRNMPGPDHKASLEPDELTDMVNGIRNVELSISGTGVKSISESESKNINIARKSIHVNKQLKKGMQISESDIIPLRPGDGISPMEWEEVIGKKLLRDINPFEKLTWSDIE